MPVTKCSIPSSWFNSPNLKSAPPHCVIARTINHIIQQTGEEHDVAKKFVHVKFYMRVRSMNKKLTKEKKVKAKEKGKRLKTLRTHTKIGQFCN